MDGYTEAEMPRRKQVTLADRPIYPELETLQLSFSLDKMREFLGPDSARASSCGPRLRWLRIVYTAPATATDGVGPEVLA